MKRSGITSRKNSQLKIDDILKIVDGQLGRCYYCNVELNFMHTQRGCHNDSPTIDRVNSENGYAIDNVVVCCGKCNTIKSDASLERLEKIVDGIKRFLKDKAHV